MLRPSAARNRQIRAVGIALAAGGLLPGLIGCHGGRSSSRFETRVELAYTPPPKFPEIFEHGGGPYRVAIARVDVDWRVRCRGDSDRRQQTVVRYRLVDGEGRVTESMLQSEVTQSGNLRGNAQIWDTTLRGQVRELLQRCARSEGVQLVLVDRDHLKQRLDERDLSVIGLVPGDPQSWKGRELGVDAFIFGELKIDTVYESSVKGLIPGDVIGGAIGGVPGWVLGRLFRPHRRVRRTMTLTGELQLVDGRSGRVWAAYPIREQWVEKKKSLFRDKDVMDLEPEEEKIREALGRCATEFVGLFFPLQRHVELLVKSGKSEFAAMGTRALAAGEYEDALEFFQQALAEKPDDPCIVFSAGVACEAVGRLDEAYRYYRKALYACDRKKIDEDDYEYQYLAAMRRVQDRLAYGSATPPAPRQTRRGEPAQDVQHASDVQSQDATDGHDVARPKGGSR